MGNEKRSMKKLVIFIFLSSISGYGLGQTKLDKKKSVFFEIAGSGGLGSINYEKHFYQKNNTELTWRAGLSIAPIDRNNGFGIVFPLMVNSLIGKSAHKLEVGLGQGITITTKGSFFILTTAALGYRYQTESSPWFYRATYTPLISYLVDFQIQHWAGISFGYTFKGRAK
jgi:hypothetical protein